MAQPSPRSSLLAIWSRTYNSDILLVSIDSSTGKNRTVADLSRVPGLRLPDLLNGFYLMTDRTRQQIYVHLRSASVGKSLLAVLDGKGKFIRSFPSQEIYGGLSVDEKTGAIYFLTKRAKDANISFPSVVDMYSLNPTTGAKRLITTLDSSSQTGPITYSATFSSSTRQLLVSVTSAFRTSVIQFIDVQSGRVLKKIDGTVTVMGKPANQVAIAYDSTTATVFGSYSVGAQSTLIVAINASDPTAKRQLVQVPLADPGLEAYFVNGRFTTLARVPSMPPVSIFISTDAQGKAMSQRRVNGMVYGIAPAFT